MRTISREEIHSRFVGRFAAPRSKRTLTVTDQDLRRAEEQLKTTFPKSFVTFLIRHGPVFTPSILDLVTRGESEKAPEGARFDVQEFLEPKQIIETHRLYSGAGMEEWLVPIAMDCMGNVFGFRREERGPRSDDRPVGFFDHDYCKTHQEAPAFDAWLSSFLHLGR